MSAHKFPYSWRMADGYPAPGIQPNGLKVFVYCETILKLRPKVFLLENVKGLAVGNAKSYLRRVFDTLNAGGYACQVFILNGASMGVPQIRERCFVIGRRKDLDLPPLKLSFNEPPILFGDIIDRTDQRHDLPPYAQKAYERRRPDDVRIYDTNLREFGKTSGYTSFWTMEDKVCHTLCTSENFLTSIPRSMNETELLKASTFPLDYEYTNIGRLRFLTGMSVPPVMTAQVAHQIAVQVFGKPS